MPSITGSISNRRSRTSFSSRSVQSGSWSRASTGGRSLVLGSGSSTGSVYGGNLSSSAGLLMSAAVAQPRGEKETMQDLNERLARYLNKVHSLETSNRELEVQIAAILEERRPVERDVNPLLAQVRDLNRQIHDLTLGNAAIMLQIDNARLSAEDFKMKLESESVVRQAVENDIDRLRRVKEEYEVHAASLRNETDLLTEEALFLKKNHAEEINGLKAQMKTEKVSVNVFAGKEPDISALVANVRTEYEELIAKNKADSEAWYQSQIQVVRVESEQTAKALDDAKAEITIKRQTIQSLELELETLKAQITGLENILGEAESGYGGEFEKLQLIISQREAELASLRNEMYRNKEKYDDLLKIKLTLEAEIAEYRRLLNGDLSEKPASPPETPSTPTEVTMRKIVKVITTTLVDGKVVDESSKVQEYTENTQLE
ncbi:keratin, type I cytoskeletal 18-A [Hemitrygon akajei]|uniref:keratin, type I cytoskeletal 18-A n=1 Tax=Hemitrygon akajei TaxID=2704970 RepID=UPI003BF942FF